MAIVSGSCARKWADSFGYSSGSVGQSQPMIAVWNGRMTWAIGGLIAEGNQRGAAGGGAAGPTSICLGQSDPSLTPYLIDIPSLKQFRQDTGLGSGVYWEWLNDEGGWTPYETRTSILLEHSYQARQGTADLGPHGYNYIVDLTSLAQVNKASGFRRQVRRQCNLPYPLASSGPPAIPSSGAACSCQQCLSHSSTGPMPSRSRHSFSSGSLNRPILQATGRAVAAHPTSVYSPYPRRPLSVGGMSWGSPWPPPASGSQLSAPLLPSSASANGLSVPSISVQLNGSTSVSSALAGMASILMSAVGLGVHFTNAPPLSSSSSIRSSYSFHLSISILNLSILSILSISSLLLSRFLLLLLSSPPPAGPAGPPPAAAAAAAVQLGEQRGSTGERPEEVIQRYMEVVAGVQDEDCIICMDQLSNASGYETQSTEEGPSVLPDTVGKFIKCGHTLHMLCMLAILQCPSCKTIYGEKTGTQPKGKMEIYSIGQSLPGHPDCGTIQIIYSIPPGLQGPEHPNPGQPYSCRGFPRFCFLPDNDKGRKVAWMRRLIFTVGTSSTTGEPDTVVWNNIHHKTEMMSNLSGHGYPDPNYLDNVLSELASQGVTEDCFKAQAEEAEPAARAQLQKPTICILRLVLRSFSIHPTPH
ncbi:hypothetical protein F7725_006454 [Dissostichus mawsoni]|uniref:E3 ubiquitin-protein ligase n=1 Tax=Dissostichus mawsoni TaxID=36200 RepID=A0A7J5XU15_DISMA|nr:hypothetical protein F7725_006454 [Dissostichus mawsoni]